MSEDKKEEVVEEAEATENTEKEDEQSSLTEQLEQSQLEAQKNLEMALRLKAEMDNLQRRTSRDIANAHKFALENFAKELLTVADSIDLGLSSPDNADVNTLKEGMELTKKQFMSVIEKFGMEIVDADGVKFNPELHEAMTTVVNPEVEPNTVVEVFQKGYSLNGRLIRPARVVVSSQ